MTWTKTSDDHPDQRIELSDAAYRVEHAALTFSNRLLLDGRIPKSRLGLLPVPESTRRDEVIAELVAARLWRDDGDGYVIVGYFDGQPSREEVEAQRAWDGVRQAIARTTAPEELERLRVERDAARQAHAIAVTRRQERAKADVLSLSESLSESRSESLRPVPPRPAPSRARTGGLHPPDPLYPAR